MYYDLHLQTVTTVETIPSVIRQVLCKILREHGTVDEDGMSSNFPSFS